ncbi:Xenotropic and polytropic retrovirus receptor 1 like protein, partial [Dictyocoela muelleri]
YLNDFRWNEKKRENRTAMCSGWSQFLFQTLLILLPSWFRFAQCLRRYRDTKQKFPHLVNAGKYASGFLVSITNTIRRATNRQYQNTRQSNPFLYLWILSALFGSTYKLIWDFKMDWGFFHRNSGENRFLREQIVYPSKKFYYFVIVENIFFRYIWIINIFIYFDNSTAEYSDVFFLSFGIYTLISTFFRNYSR